jgi:hypothetical protein
MVILMKILLSYVLLDVCVYLSSILILYMIDLRLYEMRYCIEFLLFVFMTLVTLFLEFFFSLDVGNF